MARANSSRPRSSPASRFFRIAAYPSGCGRERLTSAIELCAGAAPAFDGNGFVGYATAGAVAEPIDER